MPFLSRELEKIEGIQNRFGIRSGNVRSDFKGFPFLKNQWWYLNEEYIGYGDLSQDDILRIAMELHDDEKFVTFNEHDGLFAQESDITPFEAGLKARVIITNKDIVFP